jgi:hypothetical protein
MLLWEQLSSHVKMINKRVKNGSFYNDKAQAGNCLVRESPHCSIMPNKSFEVLASGQLDLHRKGPERIPEFRCPLSWRTVHRHQFEEERVLKQPASGTGFRYRPGRGYGSNWPVDSSIGGFEKVRRWRFWDSESVVLISAAETLR